MGYHQRLLKVVVLLLAVLAVNPAIQAANRKTRPAQKQSPAKTVNTQQDDFQKHVDQQIADIKNDLYTRATWAKLQEVKQEADSTASTIRLVSFSAGGIGFVLGCVVTFFVARRVGKSEDNLRIT